jgi:DNA-binding winged helix-turn-helix (wHTH) protein
MMNRPSQRFYLFEGFRVDVHERLLFKDNREVPLTPKVFDTLLVLLENSSHVMTKKELMQQVWPDSFVEENNLAQNISNLRKALGETKEGEHYIQTVPKRGYRFVGDVRATGGDEDVTHKQLEPALQRLPETMYARSGDVNIAYQVIGDAPLDLVFVMGWVSHLEYFWREPSFARFLLRLASFSRLILFDKRGTGLSDRVPINQLPTLEQRMDDVRAVMDAVWGGHGGPPLHLCLKGVNGANLPIC